MTPLEFLAEVLPSPDNGLYCLFAIGADGIKRHKFVERIDDMQPHIEAMLAAKADLYFALSTFKERSRKANSAQTIHAVFLDMDGYTSKKEAALALTSFLEKTGLASFGTPYLVGSGGGIHAYWPTADNVDPTTWKPIAENFKRLCVQEGLRIDHTVTADAARVLRIPDTLNFKPKYPEPRPVKLLVQGNVSMDIRQFGAAVRALITEDFAPASNAFVPTAIDLPGVRPSKAATQRSAMVEALANNSETFFAPIWEKSERGLGCAQIQFYQSNAKQDGMEPLWRGILSWAKVCKDGDEYAKKASELHPYDEKRMRTKMAEIKGPYPCAKMDSENPGVCQGCPYFGKITNALALGREIKTDNRAKEFVVPVQVDTGGEEPQQYLKNELFGEDAEDNTPQNIRTRTALRPPPPFGFSYGEHGGVYRDIKEKDATGVTIQTQVQVLPHDLFVVDILKAADQDHMVNLMAIKRVGPADDEGKQHTEYAQVLLPSKSAVSKEEALKCLAAHNIYASHGAGGDPHLAAYLRGCISEAAKMKKTVAVPIQFGWQKDNSFVYNNRVFMPDGTEVSVPMPGLENINRVTNSKGTIEEWRRPWNVLIERGMYTMLAMCMDSFGPPLMVFAEQDGFVWHIGSTDSGTGKTLTLEMKAGVWGHPERYRTGKSTSPVALQQRAGLFNNLPLLIDEITTTSRNNVEWAPAFIFDMSEGQGKERMENGTNKERINNSTWNLTCTLTSNTHLVDVLLGGRKHSSHGEMMRMLEWTPEERLVWTADNRRELKPLRNNYGVAGELWVKWLVQNRALAKSIWDRTHEKLRAQLQFSDEERYWHSACTCVIAAAIMVGTPHAGLIDVPIRKMVDALKTLVETARGVHKASRRSAEDVLNTFTRDYYGKFIVVRKDAAGKLLAEMGSEPLGKTSTRGAILGRIEHETRKQGWVEFFVEETVFRNHCASMSFGYNDFRRLIQQVYNSDASKGPITGAVSYGKKDMTQGTDGPGMRVQCLHISMPKQVYDSEYDPNASPAGEA